MSLRQVFNPISGKFDLVNEVTGNTIWGYVANYAALPLGTSSSDPAIGDLVGANASQGVWFVNYRAKGFYKRIALTGVAATDYGTDPYAGFPNSADQSTVDTGTNGDQFVSPVTLTNATVVTNKELLSNKATTMTGNESSNIIYLTAKAVYDWAVGAFVSFTGSYADPSWITSLAWSKLTGKGTYSPFYISTVVTHTGTTSETIVYSSSPDLVGILEANDMFEFECTVMASNNANTKNIRFYISDAQGSLSNQVLVGRTSVGAGWATSQRINKYIKIKGALNSNQYIDNTVHLNQNNVYTAVVPSINNAGTIDFSTGSKYLIVTLELANSADTIQIFEGHSQIFRP